MLAIYSGKYKESDLIEGEICFLDIYRHQEAKHTENTFLIMSCLTGSLSKVSLTAGKNGICLDSLNSCAFGRGDYLANSIELQYEYNIL